MEVEAEVEMGVEVTEETVGAVDKTVSKEGVEVFQDRKDHQDQVGHRDRRDRQAAEAHLEAEGGMDQIYLPPHTVR